MQTNGAQQKIVPGEIKLTRKGPGRVPALRFWESESQTRDRCRDNRGTSPLARRLHDGFRHAISAVSEPVLGNWFGAASER